jgi:hypothetical protein
MFICLRLSPFIGFCLGWCSNFVDSESGQVQSVLNSAEPHIPPPEPFTKLGGKYQHV